MLCESGPKINLSKKKIKEIKKYFRELRHSFSKSKTNEFKRSLYNIRDQKNVSELEIKETKSAFNVNYIEYESKVDKNKNLSPKRYLAVKSVPALLRGITSNHNVDF